MNPYEGKNVPLLLKPELTENRPHPVTFWLSIAAIIVATLAAIFSAIQAYEAHKTRTDAEAAEGPFLEITEAHFVGPSSLFITHHKLRRSPAHSLKGKNDAYVGSVATLRSNFVKVFVPAKTYGPSIPVDREVRMAVYMPDEREIRKAFPRTNYQQLIVELRGEIAYKGDTARQSSLPFCYVVHQGTPPSATECNDAFDEILKNLNEYQNTHP